MSEQHKVWPEIARLPGERLLLGVPHKTSESLFSEAGMADACDIVTATQALNSAQRRGPLQEFISRTAFGKDTERSQATVHALEQIADQEVTDNRAMALSASFLQSILTEKLASNLTKTENITVQPEQLSPYRASMNNEWATRLVDTDMGKSSRQHNLEKDEVLAFTVARLVSRGDASDPEIIEAGSGLYNRFLSEEDDIITALSNFRLLAYGIDKAKVKTSGFNGSTKISNMIIQSAGATLAAKVKPGELVSAIATAEKFISHQLEQPAHMRSMVPKYSIVRQNLALRLEAHRHALEMKGFGDDLANALGNGVAELNEGVADVMHNLGRLRKYGLKPSYCATGYPIRSDQAWVFSDPLPEGLDHPMLHNFLADIKLYDEDRIESAFTTEYTSFEYGSGARNVGKAVPTYQSLLMLPDGELAISSSLGVLPLRREYSAMDAESTYDLMRLSLITNFIDLVVPQEYTEHMPTTSTQGAGFFNSLKNSSKYANIGELLVPRIKLIQSSTDTLENALQNEIDMSRRQMREHDVIWHVRILPKGYKASEQAVADATERGIELADGETFVKTHTRGNTELGKISGHKAKRCA